MQKKHPWAKDSIVFVAYVFSEENNIIELWDVEIKSRQTINTVNKEYEFNKKSAGKNTCILIGEKQFTTYSSMMSIKSCYTMCMYMLEKLTLHNGENKKWKGCEWSVVNFSIDLHENN